MIFNQTKEYWLSKKGEDTAREIAQQPGTWAKTFDIVKGQVSEVEAFINSITSHKNHKIIFTGAGTSEFVGNSLTPLFLKQERDHFVSIASTDLVATPDLFIREDQATLLVSFGRSGNSPESIGAVDVVNAINPNAKHLVITCNHNGELAKREGDNYLTIKLPPETSDLSFAMTSSFTNMFLAAYLCFNLDVLENGRDRVEEIIRVANTILETHYKTLEGIVNSFDFKRIVYLGDADISGVAQESALKMLELTAGEIVTMYNSPLGFRHGPKSIINKDTLTVVYMHRNAYTRQYQRDIILEISGQREGNQLLVIDCINDPEIEALVDTYISLDFDAKADDVKSIAYIMIAQVIALFRSVSIGKTPDNPWPSGMVNRVVQGVIIYPFSKEEN